MSSIIRHGEWYWPNAQSDSLVEIQSCLHEVGIGDVDVPVWKSRNGIFSCSETWGSLRLKYPTVDWYSTVWFPLAIPRHSFILWLAFRDALTTKEKMCMWGFNGYSAVCFVMVVWRTKSTFSLGVASAVEFGALLCIFAVLLTFQDWDSVVSWFQEEVRGKSLFSVICKLRFGATVYHIWRHRNDILHGNIPRSEEGIIAQIKWQVRARLLAKGPVKIVGRNLGIVHSWNLQNLIRQ